MSCHCHALMQQYMSCLDLFAFHLHFLCSHWSLCALIMITIEKIFVFSLIAVHILNTFYQSIINDFWKCDGFKQLPLLEKDREVFDFFVPFTLLKLHAANLQQAQISVPKSQPPNLSLIPVCLFSPSRLCGTI